MTKKLKSQEQRKTVADYLVNGGIGGRKFGGEPSIYEVERVVFAEMYDGHEEKYEVSLLVQFLNEEGTPRAFLPLSEHLKDREYIEN